MLSVWFMLYGNTSTPFHLMIPSLNTSISSPMEFWEEIITHNQCFQDMLWKSLQLQLATSLTFLKYLSFCKGPLRISQDLDNHPSTNLGFILFTYPLGVWKPLFRFCIQDFISNGLGINSFINSISYPVLYFVMA